MPVCIVSFFSFLLNKADCDVSNSNQYLCQKKLPKCEILFFLCIARPYEVKIIKILNKTILTSTLLLIKLLVSLLSKEPMNSGCLSGANFINFFAPFARVPKFYASKKLNSWAQAQSVNGQYDLRLAPNFYEIDPWLC